MSIVAELEGRSDVEDPEALAAESNKKMAWSARYGEG
jgi:hypothetical protein